MLLCLAPCPGFAAAVAVFGSGANPAAIQTAVDQFRTHLGGVNNGSASGFFPTGRREINWDGVPDSKAAPNNLPLNFFNLDSPRGVILSTPGSGVQVSANAVNPTSTPARFGNINPTYPASFQTFTAQRLFTPIGSNITDVTFFVPGTGGNVAATVSGFGAVFTDVDFSGSGLQFFDVNDQPIGTAGVTPVNNGLSFTGVSFNAGERIARVRITSGNALLAAGTNDGPGSDVVALDDFIYGEPQPIEVTVTPEVEGNNTPATATALDLRTPPGAIASGAINPGNDQDYYSFTVPATSRVWAYVDTGGAQNPGANSRDSLLTLLAGDGTTILEDDDDDGTGNGGDATTETGLASTITGRTLTTGTYFLRVKGFSAAHIINPYKLFLVTSPVFASLETEPNDNTASPNSLLSTGPSSAVRVGQRAGSFLIGNPDVYSVFAFAGQTLYISTDNDPERDNTGVDTAIDLIAPDGVTQLFTADDSLAGSASNPSGEAFSFNIPNNGIYFVRVRGVGNSFGNYSVMAAAYTFPSKVQFSTAAVSVNESAGAVNLTLTRSGDTAYAQAVDIAASNGTALSGSDYSLLPGSVNFGIAVTSVNVLAGITNDNAAEPDENFSVSLSNPVGGATLGSPATQTVTIVNDDTNLQFGSAVFNVNEGMATATVTVTRSGDTGGVDTVHYATSNGNAQAGIDYTAASGDLSFMVGILSRTFTVPISNDALVEGNETINLTLSNPVGAVLGTQSTALLVIRDDEPAQFKFSAASYSTKEGMPTATISVFRLGDAQAAAKVNYAISNGTAQSATDFTAGSGTLTFAINQNLLTFSVPITDDALVEPSETVNLTLSSPMGGTLAAPSTATLILRDNEPSQFKFSATGYSVTESTSMATFMIFRSGDVSVAGSVKLVTSNGTAMAGMDYTAVNTTVNFPVNQNAVSVAVPIIDDPVPEQNETVNLGLNTPGGGVLVAPSSAVLTIISVE